MGDSPYRCKDLRKRTDGNRGVIRFCVNPSCPDARGVGYPVGEHFAYLGCGRLEKETESYQERH